jgi:hypothetical protein
MAQLPTALLLHETGELSHYDWLLANPTDPTGSLWTARLASPSSQWAAMEQWNLEPIAPHRQIYLTFEGDLGGDCGRVSRVDSGLFEPIAWTDDHIEIDLQMKHFQGRLLLDRTSETCWRVRHVDQTRGQP